jgi:AhpD family alkylhydroperoxidase
LLKYGLDKILCREADAAIFSSHHPFRGISMTEDFTIIADGAGSANGRAAQNLSGQWILPKAPLVLSKAEQQTIACDIGTVWITQGDSNDYVLKSGEQLALRPFDDVVVTAMSGPALVRRMQQQESQPLVQRKEHDMNDLTLRERELVALGAAMGSNCEPCIAFHIPVARKAGLSDEQIAEAIQIADKVRKVPAAKVLRTALSMLPHESSTLQADDCAGQCNGSSTSGNASIACCA